MPPMRGDASADPEPLDHVRQLSLSQYALEYSAQPVFKQKAAAYIRSRAHGRILRIPRDTMARGMAISAWRKEHEARRLLTGHELVERSLWYHVPNINCIIIKVIINTSTASARQTRNKPSITRSNPEKKKGCRRLSGTKCTCKKF